MVKQDIFSKNDLDILTFDFFLNLVNQRYGGNFISALPIIQDEKFKSLWTYYYNFMDGTLA